MLDGACSTRSRARTGRAIDRPPLSRHIATLPPRGLFPASSFARLLRDLGPHFAVRAVEEAPGHREDPRGGGQRRQPHSSGSLTGGSAAVPARGSGSTGGPAGRTVPRGAAAGPTTDREPRSVWAPHAAARSGGRRAPFGAPVGAAPPLPPSPAPGPAVHTAVTPAWRRRACRPAPASSAPGAVPPRPAGAERSGYRPVRDERSPAAERHGRRRHRAPARTGPAAQAVPAATRAPATAPASA